MKPIPQISVIIPTYNRERFVTKAIDSALSQTFSDYEIIVVDDGSTDNTKETLKRYEENIKYIYQDNSGVSAARNMGVKLATGEWLAFLDSDDEWKVDYLSKQIERARDNPGICMQATNCLFVALNGETRSYFEINGSLAEFKVMDYLLLEEPFCFVVMHGPWQIGSTIIRREVMTKAGLFDTSLNISEDFDLIARVALHGPFGMIKEELVNVFRRDESNKCLTSQAMKYPIQLRETNDRIYENLKRIESLKYKERNTLNRLLSSNRRSIGNLLMSKGNVKEARDYYKLALFTKLSIVSICKYIFSFLPRKIDLWLSKKYNNLKAKKKNVT